jgi:hypothetical protein
MNSWIIEDDSFYSNLHDEQVGKVYKLVCPVCGYDYCDAGETFSFSGYGAKMGEHKDLEDNWDGRGSGISIRCSGECGHEFSIRIGFHKGETFIFAVKDETIK